MKCISSRVYQITETRDKPLHSTYFQVLDGDFSSSSEESSDDESQ